LCFAKVIIIKIIRQNTSLRDQFGRVAAYFSRPYWCGYVWCTALSNDVF